MHNIQNYTETNNIIFLLSDQVFVIFMTFIHDTKMLDDPLLHFMAANIYIIYIYIGNNCNVFCCINRKALFQYRPTLLGHVCATYSHVHTLGMCDN